MLNKPVVVKTKPGEQLLGETTEFQYERIQLEGFTLEEFFLSESSAAWRKLLQPEIVRALTEE